MLSGFQLKAGRGALKVTATTLAKLTNINRMTLINLEKTSNTNFIKCHTDTLNKIEFFFKKNNLLFLDKLSVTLNVYEDFINNPNITTIFQIRAARAIFNLSLKKLSEILRININVLFSFEQGDIAAPVSIYISELAILKKFYLENGIIFPNNFSIRINE